MRLTFEAFGHELTLTIGRTLDDEPDPEHDHLAGSFDPAPTTPGGEDEVWYTDRIGFRGAT